MHPLFTLEFNLRENSCGCDKTNEKKPLNIENLKSREDRSVGEEAGLDRATARAKLNQKNRLEYLLMN